ncbi:MAG: leucine-rich repeat domain-containing protein [Acutalibacteraceae bacterium]
MPLTISGNFTKKYIGKTEVTLPKDVRSIPMRGFLVNRDLKFVALPEGATAIEAEAFYKCEKLEKILIPETVRYICSGAFRDCFNLKNIELPDGLSEIEDYTFSRCESLKYIRIPEGVTKIGRGAFSECTSLKEIVLPSTLREIDDYAFEFCYNLQTVRCAETVEKVGQSAFGYCTSLSDIHFSSALCSVAFDSFSNSSYKLPESFLTLSNSQYVSSNVYRVPDGICTITAFSMPEPGGKIKDEIILPDSVKNISHNAFVYQEVHFFNNVCVDLTRSLHFPKKMNMPKNYFRQKTQFDADMAFLLADTLWKDYVTDEDFEYMLLNQNSENALKGACERLSKNCNQHLFSMMKKTDNLPNQYEHMAVYAATYLGRIDVKVLDKLNEKAKEYNALKAVEILEKYCFEPLSKTDDKMIVPYPENVSPYTVKNYHLDVSMNSAINRVRWSSNDGYVPEYLVKYVLFSYINQLPADIDETEECPDFYTVEEADRLVSEFEQKSFLKMIGELEHYDLQMIVPICRYGTESDIKMLSEIMRNNASVYGDLYTLVAEKALKLSETYEAFNILKYIDHKEFEEYDNGEEDEYDEDDYYEVDEYDVCEEDDYDEPEEYDDGEEDEYDEDDYYEVDEYDICEEDDYDEPEEYDDGEEDEYDEDDYYEVDEYDVCEEDDYDNPEEEDEYDYYVVEEYDEDAEQEDGDEYEDYDY